MISRRGVTLGFFLLGGATCAMAQEPADRAALERLRDSLETATDSIGLKGLEAATIALAKQQRDDPLIHLRLGFIAYRIGEIGDAAPHFEDAASEFEWASELRPAWPYPWYGLGRSELAIGARSPIAVENLKQQLHLDHLSKAINAYNKAALADPTFAQPVIELVNAALRQRVRAQTDVALSVARLAAASASGNPAFQLARGRIEREVGEADSAIPAFSAYLAAGGDSGLGLLERARTEYFANRDSMGQVDYYAGAGAALSVDAVRMFRTDASWIASPAELEAFDSLRTSGARAAWLRQFWARRDVADLREPGERLAEHYRRWFFALRSFKLVSPHRHYDFTEVYRTTESEFDDRGIVFLRQGAPDQRAQYAGSGGAAASDLEPNESWLYHRPGGDLIFHFVSRGDVQDFKLVQSLVDALSFDRRNRLASGGDTSALVRGLFASRSTFGPMYERIGNTLSSSNVMAAIAEDRQTGTASITVGTTTDASRHHFLESLDPTVGEFVVGAADSSGKGQVVHVVFAIPADRLTPLPVASGIAYPLRFRLYVSDRRDSLIATIDTLRVFGVRRPLRSPEFLSGQLEVPVPAGAYHARLMIETRDHSAGNVIENDSLTVGNFSGREFTVSDLVVGHAGDLAWVSGHDTIVVNPLDRLQVGGEAQIYYEVYGLTAGTPYHTEIRLEKRGGGSIFGAIRRLFGGGRPPVLLAFDATSDGVASRVHRAVALRDTPTGEYLLTVRITDPVSQRVVTRTHHFEVVAGN
jgi:GWxTD domain-containing protein